MIKKPPDFNLLPPEQLSQKNINDVEGELAKEILFGLDEEESDDDSALPNIGVVAVLAITMFAALIGQRKQQ